jgi:hypothetical protein
LLFRFLIIQDPVLTLGAKLPSGRREPLAILIIGFKWLNYLPFIAFMILALHKHVLVPYAKKRKKKISFREASGAGFGSKAM